MIDIYMLPASIDNGTQGSVTVYLSPDQCMSRHVLKVNRVGNGHNQTRRSIDLGASKWDGGSGFGCTTTLPAPKKN